VHSIADSTRRMDVLIEHMKQFWKDHDENSEERFDLHDAIDKALLLIASRIASHGIDLQLSTTKHSLPIKGKQIYIEQVIINLVFNSIQALDIHNGEKKIIKISSRKKGNMGFIEVQDSGPGVSPDIQNTLFEPFSTTKSRAENMGLGLAIVKQIVDRLEGSISVENNRKSGLTILIGIPLYTNH
ncbi:MAG: ATP-binding protein, partial [Candidatus Cloacimonadaceae bacterium]|nr:ATP-binding protein [Candidatus Cloacimonadaceae bacterium]